MALLGYFSDQGATGIAQHQQANQRYQNYNQGTGVVDDDKLAAAVNEIMDLSPRNIREHLNLSRPIYVPTAAYGHFGREPTDDGGFSWERTDLVDSLKAALT